MNPDIQLIILFGSHAKGYARKNSDIDIAVLASRPLTLHDHTTIEPEIATLLKANEDRLDVIDLWNAPPLLQREIAESGKLIYGDPFAFIRFRIRAWKRYLDTAKFRRLGEQQLKSYAERSHTQ